MLKFSTQWIGFLSIIQLFRGKQLNYSCFPSCCQNGQNLKQAIKSCYVHVRSAWISQIYFMSRKIAIAKKNNLILHRSDDVESRFYGKLRHLDSIKMNIIVLMIFAICWRSAKKILCKNSSRLSNVMSDNIWDSLLLVVTMNIWGTPSLLVMVATTAAASFLNNIQFNLGLFIDGKFISSARVVPHRKFIRRKSEGILNFSLILCECERGCKIKNPWSWVRADYNQLFATRRNCAISPIGIQEEESTSGIFNLKILGKFHEFKLIFKQKHGNFHHLIDIDTRDYGNFCANTHKREQLLILGEMRNCGVFSSKFSLFTITEHCPKVLWNILKYPRPQNGFSYYTSNFQILHVVFVASQNFDVGFLLSERKFLDIIRSKLARLFFTVFVWNTSEACSKFRDSMIAKKRIHAEKTRTNWYSFHCWLLTLRYTKIQLQCWQVRSLSDGSFDNPASS